MGCNIFLFGTLRHDTLREKVMGRGVAGRAAILADHAVLDLGGLPVLHPAAGQAAQGLKVELSSAELARLDLYEAVFGYQRQPVTIACDGQTVAAQLYAPAQAVSVDTARPWRVEDWAAAQAEAALAAADEVFTLAGQIGVEALRIRYPMLLAHHASRVRAGRAAQPARLRRDWGREDVISRQRMSPYAHFFGVQVDDLRFRRFDGSLGPLVRRAGFVMSDAITLLPYDPARDCVMVIEQFRYGPYLRGDANCWVLEPIAGRIDPGESPEACALREAQEEAALDLSADALIPIGNSYPSPGAVSEFLFGFVGLCDLPKTREGVAGLAFEAEDIRSHILPLDDLMALIAQGEVQNGPLIQSTYWLALHRAELRKP